MSTIVEMLEKVLTDLKTTGIVEESVIVSREGLLMMSDIADEEKAKMLAAMTAMVFNAAKRIIPESKNDTPNNVIVESKKGRVVVMSAGSKALLAVRGNPHAELGLILIEMNSAANKIEELI